MSCEKSYLLVSILQQKPVFCLYVFRHDLQQADKWTVLSSEIEDVIQSGDADLLTSKLVAMQQSLVSFTIQSLLTKSGYITKIKQ